MKKIIIAQKECMFYADMSVVFTWCFLIGTIIFQFIDKNISQIFLLVGTATLTIGGIQYLIWRSILKDEQNKCS